MMFIEQGSTPTLCFGPCLDDTTGKDAETLTTDYTLLYLSKNGGDLTAKHDTTDLVHDLLGYHHLVLDATDTNTLGILRIAMHVAGTLPVWQDYMVVTHDFYQSMCGDHVIGAAAIAAYDPPTNAEFELRSLPSADYVVVGDTIAGCTLVTTCTTNTDMVTAATLLDHNVTEHTTASTLGAYVNDVYKGVVTDATGTNVAADVVALKAETVLIVEDTGTTIPATLAALATTADVAAGVLDHDVTAHTTASTVGKYVNDMYAGVVTDAAGTNIGADSTEILTRLPDATAGAANGLVICGTNAAITFTSATADAVTMSATGANKSGLKISGNGSGVGIDVDGGASAAAISAEGGATSDSAVYISAPAAAGVGLELWGGAAGLRAMSDTAGAVFTGDTGGSAGTGIGLQITGKSTSAGLVVAGGGTSGNGITVSATSGEGIEVTTSSGHGVNLGGGGDYTGLNIYGGLTGSGVTITGGGTSGNGITVTTTNGAGVAVTTGAAGVGIDITAGGDGIDISSGTAGISIATTDGDGIEVSGNGSGHVDIDANLFGTITGNITGDITGTLATVTNLTNLPAAAATAASIAALATTADVADAVVDEVITSGHTGAGSLAAVVNTVAADTTTDIPALIADLPTAVENALAVLNQGLATSDADALDARTVRSALRLLRNYAAVSGGILTVKKENDSDNAWTAAVTTDAGAAPITIINPT